MLVVVVAHKQQSWTIACFSLLVAFMDLSSNMRASPWGAGLQIQLDSTKSCVQSACCLQQWVLTFSSWGAPTGTCYSLYCLGSCLDSTDQPLKMRFPMPGTGDFVRYSMVFWGEHCHSKWNNLYYMAIDRHRCECKSAYVLWLPVACSDTPVLCIPPLTLSLYSSPLAAFLVKAQPSVPLPLS